MVEESFEDKKAFILRETDVYQDYPKPGVAFKDFFSLTRKPEAFKKLIECTEEQILREVGQPGEAFNTIIGLESRGFILGPLLAAKWGVAFVPIRKKGKLPGKLIREEYKLEYGTDIVEIQEAGVASGSKVILIDDLLATGGTLRAAENLVAKIPGVEVVASYVTFELLALNGREKLTAKCVALISE